MRLDQPFTPQLLYELAKMDGAIIVNRRLTKLAYANVQLMPDPTIPSAETGTRHRTAERVAKQTGALVDLHLAAARDRHALRRPARATSSSRSPTCSAKTNQAVATLETYRKRLEQVLTRLTALEFQNAVMLDDVLVVLQRAELTTRMAEEIERDCVELGAEGRLIRMQLEELVADVPDEKAAVVFDYHADGGAEAHPRVARGARSRFRTSSCSSSSSWPSCSATRPRRTPSTTPSRRAATACSRTSRGCPDSVVRPRGRDLAGPRSDRPRLQRELEAVEGVGAVRARARSARGSAGSRSTTLSTATCSSSAEFLRPARVAAKNWRFPAILLYFRSVRRRSSTIRRRSWRIQCERGGSGLYKVGDKVVYPHHGAGTVVKKETREVLGEKREYLTIKILHNDMTVNVPCENAEKVGLRKVIDEKMVEQVRRRR